MIFAGGHELKRQGVLHDGVDPAIDFTAAYMQILNYFLVEKLFGGNRRFGISEEQVIIRLTDIYSRGLLKTSNQERVDTAKERPLNIKRVPEKGDRLNGPKEFAAVV